MTPMIGTRTRRLAELLPRRSCPSPPPLALFVQLYLLRRCIFILFLASTSLGCFESESSPSSSSLDVSPSVSSLGPNPPSLPGLPMFLPQVIYPSHVDRVEACAFFITRHIHWVIHVSASCVSWFRTNTI